MELRLMELRKRAGYRNRDEFARVLGINKHTYRSWETGAAMMSLSQAYDVALALGCTLNDLVGMDSPVRHYLDPRQAELNRCWESLDPERQDRIIANAQDMEVAKRGESATSGQKAQKTQALG